jgi:hypothetical protein
VPWGISLPEDAVNRTHNEVMQARKEKEKGQSVAHQAMKE